MSHDLLEQMAYWSSTRNSSVNGLALCLDAFTRPTLVILFVARTVQPFFLARSAGVFFGRANVFARENATYPKHYHFYSP